LFAAPTEQGKSAEVIATCIPKVSAQRKAKTGNQEFLGTF